MAYHDAYDMHLQMEELKDEMDALQQDILTMHQKGFAQGIGWALNMLDAQARGVITIEGYAELLKGKLSEVESEIYDDE